MISPEAVDEAVDLMGKRYANYARFFSMIEDPDWVPALAERGYFKQPLDPEIDGDRTSYPRWPESECLARLAGSSSGQIDSVLLGVPSTDNVLIRVDLIKAAIDLGPEAATAQARKESTWIGGQSRLDFMYPETVADLCLFVATTSEWSVARRIFRALTHLKYEGSSLGGYKALVDNWEFEELCNKLIPGLAEAVGIESVREACGSLCRAFESNENLVKPRDYSEISRSAIHHHEQNTAMDARDSMIYPTFTAAKTYAESGSEQQTEVLELLESHGWDLFFRIALQIRTDLVDSNPGAVVEAMLNPSILRNVALNHEYALLSKAGIQHLSDQQQDEWLNLVRLGPDYLTDENGTKNRSDFEQDEFDRYLAFWVRDHLAMLGSKIPEKWVGEREALEAEYGESDHPEFRSMTRSWMGPTSPVSPGQLDDMTASEIVEMLMDWTAPEGVEEPTPEGLGRFLADRVKRDPSGFDQELERIVKLDPTYVRFLLSGFEQALKDGKELPWAPVLEICRVSAQAPTLNTDPDERRAAGSDPDWTWCCRQAASLIGQGLQDEAIPPELADQVWEVIEPLSWNPEPTPEYEDEYGGSNMRPLDLSINTARGEAVHTVIRFAVWKKQILDPQPEHGLTEDSPHRRNLEAHLDPNRDPSPAIRAAFGLRMNAIGWLDLEWIETNLNLLFPDNDQLRAAAWETYVGWNRAYPVMYDLFVDQYSRAIDELAALDRNIEAGYQNYTSSLVEHIAHFYWVGKFGLEDGSPIVRFLDVAPGSLIGRLIEVIGRALLETKGTEVSNELKERFVALWSAAKAAFEERDDVDGISELSSFGLWFASTTFDTEWASIELIDLIGSDVEPKPPRDVVKRVADLSVENPALALEILNAFANHHESMAWSLYEREDLFKVAANALNAGGEIAAMARVVINRLAAEGHVQYLSLLE